ncbi:MAG: hypothetical protein AABX65_02820 [Nanoarchaeota archaeon]
MKTIAISEEVHRELVNIKLQERERNIAALISILVSDYKRKKLLEAGGLLKRKMSEKNLGFYDLLKSSRKIREEIADEWF